MKHLPEPSFYFCSVNLVHLNALFEKIADRKVMGITAKKLYKLILKTDVNKHKLIYYRHKLEITVDTGCISSLDDCPSSKRVISRGPFMALFKDESIKFVNSLEVAARPMIKRKRKTVSTSKSSVHSKVISVKTEPLKLRDHEDASVRREKSPKHRKIEDKTGMIIVAEVDNDEISTVSVSPTGVESVKSCISFISESGGSKSSTIKKRQSYSRTNSSCKSARKVRRRKRSDSLRSVRSVGDDSKDSSAAKTLFSVGSSDAETAESSETSSSHFRSNSFNKIDSVNFHGLMNGIPFHNNPIDVFSSYQPYESHRGSNPTYQPSFMFHGEIVSSTIPYHNPHLQYHYMKSFQNPLYSSSVHYGGESSIRYQVRNDIDYEDCFFFKGLAKFIRKIFGFNSSQSGITNMKSFGPVEKNTLQKSGDFVDEMPHKRPISRVYDSDYECDNQNTNETCHRFYTSDIQRVLSYKLKIDDDEQPNRPRVYSAPDQQFLKQNMNVRTETELESHLSNISTCANSLQLAAANENKIDAYSSICNDENICPLFFEDSNIKQPIHRKKTTPTKKTQVSIKKVGLQEFRPNMISKSSRRNSDVINGPQSVVPSLLKRGSSLTSSEALSYRPRASSIHHYR